MLALLPVVLGLASGGAIGPVLAGLSITQWLGIANGVLTIAPKARAELVALHEVFNKMDQQASLEGDPQRMALSAAQYFVDNPPDEVDRTQEDINQDERMDKFEADLRRVEQRLSRLEGKLINGQAG